MPDSTAASVRRGSTLKPWDKGDSSEISSQETGSQGRLGAELSKSACQELSIRAPLLFLPVLFSLHKDSSALDGLRVPPPASLVCYLQIKLSLQ